MRLRRDGHDDGVDSAEEGAGITHHTAAMLGSNRCRAGGILVHDGHEVDARECRENADVMPPEMANADDSRAKR